jgi:hypothetical protein
MSPPQAETPATAGRGPETTSLGGDNPNDNTSTAIDTGSAVILPQPDEAQVHNEMLRILARREAEQRISAGDYRPDLMPQGRTLAYRRLHPKPDPDWRIDGWLPTGGRLKVDGQYKSGKTELRNNLVRCLVDGARWLDAYPTTPIIGTLAILDFEMGEAMSERWLRDQNIRDEDRVILFALRGSPSSFNPFDENSFRWWRRTLSHAGVQALVIDPLRPALDALGLSEDKDIGRFLVKVEELAASAGIAEQIIFHHMGHNLERGRGDSAQRGWPDVEWRLVRETDDPASTRYIAAFGRDVDQPEARLEFDTDTRRLSMAGGSRRQAAARNALDAIADLLDGSEALSTNRIETALTGTEHPRTAIRAGLRLGVNEGTVTETRGQRNAKLYTLNLPASPVRRTSPPVRQRSHHHFASSPIGGEVVEEVTEGTTSPGDGLEPEEVADLFGGEIVDGDDDETTEAGP